MKRRDMIIKSVLGGALISQTNPLNAFGNNSGKNNEKSLIGNALRFPPVFANGGTMTLAESNVQVWPGQNTPTISINGSFPGPSVVIQKNSILTANFVNNYTDPATIHWHGISTPEAMDGHPKDSIPPGGNFTYTFPVLNRAGTYFYHSHAHMHTAKHVYKGFAGFFIVEDPDELMFGLPRGSYDVPLCIQDRRTANIPGMIYDPVMMDIMHGFLGDTVLVNGTPEPFFEVSKTLYRFRLLNGSNARVYKIALSNNQSFHLIGTDGGLIDAPVSVNSLFLSPGERADVLIDFSQFNVGDNVTLKSLQFTAPGSGTYRQGTEMNIIRFDVTGTQSSGGVIPASFNPITYYNPANAKTVRNFTLTMTGGTMERHKINGLSFEMERIDWETPLNSLEEWKIINATDNLHPMHSHGNQFQVYSRNGNTNLPPGDKGWKDTVLLNPFETVRTLVKFTDYKGIYLYHCHNLEHEDDGMMLNFKIVDPIGINENNEIVENFELHQNFPNPFNPETTIKFNLKKDSNVDLTIFDISGKKVETLMNGFNKSGNYNVKYNAKDLSSGEYVYRLTAGDFSVSKKMTVIK
ncbi:MAG: multicopper oxidase domain-containing protein [Ignavibacteria bacterium]